MSTQPTPESNLHMKRENSNKKGVGGRGIHPSRDLGSLASHALRDDAIRARDRVLQQIEIRYETRPAWHYGKARDKAIRLLTRRYLPAINAIRDAVSHKELETLQDTLTERLDAGWEMEPTETRDALFLRLLAEYEVVSDCLSEHVLDRYMSRLPEAR